MATVKKFKPLLIACAMSALSMAAHAQVSNDVVKIGVMSDMTGPYAGEVGPGLLTGARMAVEDFGGKVLGKPIEVVVADDQNKPDVGTGIARKWIESDKVDAIVGGSNSAIALGIANLMKQNNKPYFITGSQSADLTGKSCSPMTFQFVSDTYSLTKASIQALMAQGAKTFYFITVDYAYGAAMQTAATRFVEAAGGKVAGSVRHPLGTTDFSQYLLQAQASKANAVVMLNSGLDLINAMKQAGEYRLAKSGQTLGVTSMSFNGVVGMGLEVGQGVVFGSPWAWNINNESKTWSERFMERSRGSAPGANHAGAYSATMHYLKAVAAAGTDEGVAVAAKVRSTPINDFQFKNVSIREDGQVMRPMQVMQVKTPAESKYKLDYIHFKGEMPADQVWRPLAEGGCDLVKAK
ncbi:ABC transporter substrate-binding protein [Hydrogenophaga palleronii]|uniref:ABC transporter substrate-binding protein n=1 Tax=Hydrogenophaga palleronii TaxID=65655 RepID=UPI000A000451|nr:ABC transporter substrate-binding protein [Hydrogenophaga palleronii]